MPFVVKSGKRVYNAHLIATGKKVIYHMTSRLGVK